MKLKILVAADDASLRSLIKTCLTICGYQVAEAQSGSETLALLAKQAPDLVLLDFCMPDLSGLTVLQEIRRSNRDVAVIMSTALARPEWAEAAMAAGADGYLGKPYDFYELRQTVAAVLMQQPLCHFQQDVFPEKEFAL